MTASRAASAAPSTPQRGQKVLDARDSAGAKAKLTGGTPTNAYLTPSKTPGKSREKMTKEEVFARKVAAETERKQRLSAAYAEAEDDSAEDEVMNEAGGGDFEMKDVFAEKSKSKLLIPKKVIGGITTAAAYPKRFAISKVPNNGRHKGRQLVRWSAAADQLLLLNIQYECYKHGIVIPWDAVARRFAAEKGPPTSQCMIQHLSKLRSHMLDSGRWVPPLMGRTQQRQMVRDQDVRGNVRYLENGESKTRDVEWNEDLSHLVNPMDIQPLPPSRSVGARKLFLNPEEGDMTTIDPSKPKRSRSTKLNPGSATRTAAPRARARRAPAAPRKRAARPRAPRPRAPRTLAHKVKTEDSDDDDEYKPTRSRTVRAKRAAANGQRVKASDLLEPLTDEDEPTPSDDEVEFVEDEEAEEDYENPSHMAATGYSQDDHSKYYSEEDGQEDEEQVREYVNDEDELPTEDEAGNYYDEYDELENVPENFVITGHPDEDAIAYAKSLAAKSTPTAQAKETSFGGSLPVNSSASVQPLAVAKSEGMHYPKAFARIIAKFDSKIFSAEAARIMWDEAMVDHDVEIAMPAHFAGNPVAKPSQVTQNGGSHSQHSNEDVRDDDHGLGNDSLLSSFGSSNGDLNNDFGGPPAPIQPPVANQYQFAGQNASMLYEDGSNLFDFNAFDFN